MEERVRVAVCVDDTDDLTKETSTGEVAEAIAVCVAELGGSMELEITRHQLLLDERVPYTSHNSAMAFTAWVPAGGADILWERASHVVREMMASASDPGLCMARVPSDADDALLYDLIAFGRRAKEEYVSKEEAYELADRIPWLRLEELGGDGQGVVGALAGVGLRLSGSDGRFRGKWDLQAVCEAAPSVTRNRKGGRGDGKGKGRGDGSGKGRRHKEAAGEIPTENAAAGLVKTYPVARICEALGARVSGRAIVIDPQGNMLPGKTPVLAASEAKPLLFAGCMAVVAQVGEDGIARPCSKEDLEADAGCLGDMDRSCPAFEFDNDQEEYGATDDMRACPNCLYRRWTAGGFTCMRQAGVRSFSEVVA